jgi:PHD/YefM family antitoxin component YafN of YafNO toxin-antitoxin module
MNAPPNVTVVSSRQFNQDRSRAKRAAKDGPVIITERGEPAFVLMSKAEYDRLKTERDSRMTVAAMAKGELSLRDALMMPNGDDIDFDPPRLEIGLKPANLD